MEDMVTLHRVCYMLVEVEFTVPAWFDVGASTSRRGRQQMLTVLQRQLVTLNWEPPFQKFSAKAPSGFR